MALEKSMSKQKKTKYEILNKVSVLDDELYGVLEHASRKFQFNKEHFVKQALCEAVQLLLDAIHTDPRIKGMAEEKVFLLDRSLSRLEYCQYEVFRLNKGDAFDNDTASRLIEMFNDIYGDYRRLRSTIVKKFTEIESDERDYGPFGELSEIRTADCGTEGGSDA